MVFYRYIPYLEPLIRVLNEDRTNDAKFTEGEGGRKVRGGGVLSICTIFPTM